MSGIRRPIYSQFCPICYKNSIKPACTIFLGEHLNNGLRDEPLFRAALGPLLEYLPKLKNIQSIPEKHKAIVDYSKIADSPTPIEILDWLASCKELKECMNYYGKPALVQKELIKYHIKIFHAAEPRGKKKAS
ncbi:MAG: hypothetical protein WCJ19_01690 [bacterium]